MHKDEGLSFKNVVTFNLDEYYPMKHGTWRLYLLTTFIQLFHCSFASPYLFLDT